MAGKRTRLVRVDLETDRLIACNKVEGTAVYNIGAYVEAHREELDVALDHTSYRIETAADPNVRDPRTGLTRAERDEMFGRLD